MVADVSLVIVWRFLERLPLLPIMTKDDQRHLLALDQIQELACAGTQLLLVVISGPLLPIGSEQALHHDRVDRQQY